MRSYHVAFYLPRSAEGMVVAEALDFPGAVTQGFDLPDARLMIASALEDLARALLEEGKPIPIPRADAVSTEADLIELVALPDHLIRDCDKSSARPRACPAASLPLQTNSSLPLLGAELA